MILTGINAFIDNSEKGGDDTNNRVSVLNMINRTDFSVLQFRNLTIKDKQKWHVGRAFSLNSAST